MSVATSARGRYAAARAITALAVLASGTTLLVGCGSKSSPSTSTSTLTGRAVGAVSAYHVAYPSTWRPLTDAELAAIANPPIGGLRRRDGDGVLLVRLQPAIPGPLSSVTAALTVQLRKTFPDFKAGSARVIAIGSGHAFSYTFTRASSGAAHVIVLVPASAGGQDYAIDAEVPGGQRQPAVEVGQIIRTFHPG
jgi:hypothetical protein